MKYSAAYKLLTDMRDAAVSCLSVPSCSYVWTGCDLPLSCGEKVTVVVMADIEISMLDNNCTYGDSLDVTVVLDICGGSPETAKEANEASCKLYKHLLEVHNGLKEWYHAQHDVCSGYIEPGGFRCGSMEQGNADCIRYISHWKVDVSD